MTGYPSLDPFDSKTGWTPKHDRAHSKGQRAIVHSSSPAIFGQAWLDSYGILVVAFNIINIASFVQYFYDSV